MSEENVAAEGVDPAPQAPEPGIGQQLRAAREEQGLSVIDVAQRLKFAPRQIDALESDNLAALPGLTFVRGFIRSYAKLLGLDADPLVGALEQAAAREAGPSTVQLQSLTATPQPFPMRNTSASGSAWPWVLAMIVAVVGLGGFALYQWQAPDAVTHPATPAAQPGSGTTPVMPPNVTPVAADPSPVSAGAAVGAGAPAEAARAETGKAEPAKADGAKPEEGKGKIRLVFSGESWTEIRQAGGQVVFSRQSAAGSEAWVDGQPPFDFVIGNAPAVKLYYRGSEVDLKPYIKVTVARMQLK